MVLRIQEKIAFIRSQPEAVRLRYLFVCLGVAMLFIVIIWLFSVRESFQALSEDRPSLPSSALQESTENSLKNMLNPENALRIESQTKDGEQYMNEQAEVKSDQKIPSSP